MSDACEVLKPRLQSLSNGSAISSIPTMTEQEKGVKPFCELRGHQTEDEAFTAEKQSRWDALSVAAIGEM